MKVQVFVEGGGNRDKSMTECRKAFKIFFDKALGDRSAVRVAACGSRYEAFKDFQRTEGKGDFAILLVDSEAPVGKSHDPWAHLRKLEGWEKPDWAGRDQAHLMVQCMESWFLADPERLASRYGKNFRRSALPGTPIEQIEKRKLTGILKKTTRREYDKVKDGFELIALIHPAAVRNKSRHARLLLETLESKIRV